MVRVARAFPALCALSLALPFLAGWAISGTLYGGLTAFLWAGLVRIALLQHVTWSVNSLCHVVGTRPFATRRHDRSTNLWPLALLSFGESWHNGHHSEPDLRPSRPGPAASSTLRRADPPFRAARLGQPTCTGPTPNASRPAEPTTFKRPAP